MSGSYHGWRAEFAYRLLPDNIARLLDVGCYDGRSTSLFFGKAREVYGIDIDVDAVRKGKKNHREIKFKFGNAEKLTEYYGRDFFDAVVFLDVLEHVRDEKKVLGQIHKVLKRNGILIISVPHTGLFSFLDIMNLKIRFPRAYALVCRTFGLTPHYLNLYFAEKGMHVSEDYKFEYLRKHPREFEHRHYSLGDIKKLLGNKFVVEEVHRGGLFLVPFFYLAEGVSKKLLHTSLRPLLVPFVGVDYEIEYGRFASDMVIKAKKL